MKLFSPIPGCAYGYSSFSKKTIQYTDPVSCAIIALPLKAKDVFFTGDNDVKTNTKQSDRSQKKSITKKIMGAFSRLRSAEWDELIVLPVHNQPVDPPANFLNSLYYKPLKHEVDGLVATVENISKNLKIAEKTKFKESIEALFDQKQWSKDDGILKAITKPLREASC